MMRRVLIVGTGLIGASIGLALRAAGFDGEIIGTGPTAKTLGDRSGTSAPSTPGIRAMPRIQPPQPAT